MKNIIKKTLITCAILLASFIPILSLNASSVYAEGPGKAGGSSQQQTEKDTDADSGFTGRQGDKCPQFLGLTSWDCGVDIHDEDSLKAGIWTIVANVATDLTVIAAYLVTGYVLYGGYLYMFSGGDPSKVASGKKTLIQAFTGLAIVMSANIILNTIRIVLVRQNSLSQCATTIVCVGENGDGLNLMVTNAISWVCGIGALVASIFVVLGGISYMTSSGDPSKIKKAKDTILYALIGLVIVALAQIITAFVSNMIRDANKPTALINQTTISKEVYEKNI